MVPCLLNKGSFSSISDKLQTLFITAANTAKKIGILRGIVSENCHLINE